MPTGSLRLIVTDVLGEPIQGSLTIRFSPATRNEVGESMVAEFNSLKDSDLTISGLPCLGGVGSRYRVELRSRNYRVYSFFQRLVAGKTAQSSDNQIRLVVNPSRVRDIEAPEFAALPPQAQALIRTEEEYLGLDPLRQACFLNIVRKAAHPTGGATLAFLSDLVSLQQDRFFCRVTAGLDQWLRESPVFKSAPNTLHKPLPGYALIDSFKSRDAHANIQLTLMKHRETGGLAADVDIDESSGIEHGFEVIRNAVTGGRTNPYLIRELLLLAEPSEQTLFPGYRFIF